MIPRFRYFDPEEEDDMPTASDFDPEHCLCGALRTETCIHLVCKGCGDCWQCEEARNLPK